jgi:hypothetical protein
MGRTPNYRFDRMQRDKAAAKAEKKQAEKDQAAEPTDATPEE